jgi:hypothetical protein
MSTKSLVQDKQYELVRRNKRTGQIETVVYTGNIKQKPTGWRIKQK